MQRYGTKWTVATGLATVGVALVLLTGVPVNGHYVSDVMWRMMLMAAGMGLVMAPATESIMGSLPLGKAGVGSAVNDTTRQVGGALGEQLSDPLHDRDALGDRAQPPCRERLGRGGERLRYLRVRGVGESLCHLAGRRVERSDRALGGHSAHRLPGARR